MSTVEFRPVVVFVFLLKLWLGGSGGGPPWGGAGSVDFGSGPYGLRWQKLPICSTLRAPPLGPPDAPYQLQYFLTRLPQLDVVSLGRTANDRRK